MALRWPLEAHFEVFWVLFAECLPDGLWRLIWSSSAIWWQNGCGAQNYRISGAILWLKCQEQSCFTWHPIAEVSRTIAFYVASYDWGVQSFCTLCGILWLKCRNTIAFYVASYGWSVKHCRILRGILWLRCLNWSHFMWHPMAEVSTTVAFYVASSG